MRNPVGIMNKSLFATVLMAAAACQVLAGRAGAEPAFGKDIPLQLAAKSLVPSGYSLDISPDVDAGKPVSWPESQNWKKSLAAAAASGGYSAVVDGKTVRISGKGSATVQKASLKTEDRGEPARRAAAVPAGDVDVASVEPFPDASGDGGAAWRRVREERRVRLERGRHSAMAAAREERRAARPTREVRRREPGAVEEVDEAASGPVVPASGFVLMPPHAERVRGPAREAAADEGAAAPSSGSHVARAGESLAATLQEWAERDGWKLEWKSDYQYSLKSSARLGGDFVGAATELVKSMDGVRPQPTAKFYRGNKVLVIGNDGLDEAAAQ